MTGLLDRPVRSSLPNDTAVGALRPVLPKRGLPQLMRRLIGVNEGVLDWVPEDRPRYTRLGFIVLNTGLLAGVSMHMALSTVAGNHWWLVVADLAWAAIIITLDSWLISSTHGATRTSLAGTYLPRLVLSALLGLVIAEPLVLSVFHQPISNEIKEYRKAEIDGYQSALVRCNPISGARNTDQSCDGYAVAFSKGPDSVRQELDRAVVVRDQLKAKVADVDGKLAELERLARDECAGRAGPGLSAVPGEGPECKRNRTKADEFRRDGQVEALHQQLAGADLRIEQLNGELAEASGATEREINAAIDAAVAEKRGNLTDKGLLDEFDALGRLSAKSAMILLAHVLLALLLIALDCMPVLSKMLSGRTAYDEVLRQQVHTSTRLHERQLRASEKRDAVGFELLELRATQKLRSGIEEISGEDRSAQERRKIEIATQIDRLAAALERQH
ncbi:DUF4407 domain-containing protein [Actinokineospora auranticolor]|uniref:Uncharacterized protein DUF4407 n=1 Tax=Actinokineospora auranticolor TaxID=155976 RepID=A0A2S6GZ22_9PSEU|nr:DUF4407 domain-containing protein [Actinokineospora auranticolor]PPK70410.1 uncharacterized protein DUF4407 [Actinokineospora auranticolor]